MRRADFAAKPSRREGSDSIKANEFLEAGLGHMKDRVSTYDKPYGERSMAATVDAFKAVTGDGKVCNEERGWLFMVLLKLVRSQVAWGAKYEMGKK